MEKENKERILYIETFSGVYVPVIRRWYSSGLIVQLCPSCPACLVKRVGGRMMEALVDFIKEVNKSGTEKRNGKKIQFNFVRRKRRCKGRRK